MVVIGAKTEELRGLTMNFIPIMNNQLESWLKTENKVLYIVAINLNKRRN